MGRAWTLLAALVLAGCGMLDRGGTTYPVSARDARARLLLTEPPLYLFGDEVAKARVSRDGDGTVRWLLVDRLDTGMLALVARSEEAGADRTRVSVSVEAPPGGRRDEVARRLDENRGIANFFRAAMAEQIDATFENREFDMAAIQGELVAAAISVAPQMQASVDQAARRSEARDRSNIENAYRRQAQGSSYESYSDKEPAYGEPMDPAAGSD